MLEYEEIQEKELGEFEYQKRKETVPDMDLPTG